MGRHIFAAAMLLLAAAPVPGAAAQPSPADYCRRVGTDDTLRAIPAALVPAVARLFQLESMPAEQMQRSTYFRCADRRVFVCNVGANLPCGKADTRRTLPGAVAWCAAHPGSQTVPASATGSATIYQWRCDGPRPVASGPALGVDRRGFVAQYWKRLGP